MEKRFGTFNGVFLPTFLTIIGVIYFLRLGWIVGNAGILGTVAIIVIAHIITISTAFSMASITTNMKVKGGGAYYLISRSLGLEIGGSIGITLYLSQTISVALYILGFIESVLIIFPDVNKMALSLIITFVVGIISIIGADIAVKAQYFIFTIILLALGTVLISGDYSVPINLVGKFEESKNFWTAFAIFFPAVTGILAGVSMSGDLKQPRKNIPKGTFIAIGVTFVIYMAQAFWFSVNIPASELMSNKLILLSRVKFPIFIIGGIWAATLSSALGSIIAAPRTMQALAKDGVLPKILGKGSGAANEPRIATGISFVIALVFIVMGNLDLVAPVITMFFLNTYGAVNLVSGFEVLVGNPSYRPTFKTPWYVSIVGALGSYWVMFLINKTATVISLAVTVLIYLYLSNKKISRTWGDLRNGIWMSIARFSLLKVRFSNVNESKNWKPDILVFSGNPRYRSKLVYLANLLVKGNGIITLLTYVVGDIKNKLRTRKVVMENMNNYLQKNNILAFPEVIISSSFKDAAKYTIQANGIGNLKPNTVLMGFTSNPKNVVDYVSFIDDMIKLRKNILILKYNEERRFGNHQKIDIWWGGMQNNGKLMLLLAHIISLNDQWRDSDVRIMTIANKASSNDEIRERLNSMLEHARIKAEVEIIEMDGAVKSQDIIKENSKNSDLVILGLAYPEEGKEEEYLKRIDSFTEGLPTTLLVKGINVDDIF